MGEFEVAIREAGNLHLQPGMQTIVMVKTGKHTLMTYFTNALVRRFQMGLSKR